MSRTDVVINFKLVTYIEELDDGGTRVYFVGGTFVDTNTHISEQEKNV